MGGVLRSGRVTRQVRYKGVSIAQTFANKTVAERWADKVKLAIDDGRWPVKELIQPELWERWGFSKEEPNTDNFKPHGGWSLAQALTYYLETVSPTKKGYGQERVRIAWWCRQPLAVMRLDAITAHDLQTHIDARLAGGRKSNTVRNEMFLLSALYETANETPLKKGWGLEVPNPVKHVLLPPPPPSRKRRLEEIHEDDVSEEEAILAAVQAGPGPVVMTALIVLAIETGMRLSELLDLRVGEVKRSKNSRYIERSDSKNNERRRVILSTRASAALDALLAELPKDADGDRRLLMLSKDQAIYRWRRARKIAKAKSLRFHDLRHEGLSRMANKGLNVSELKSQSGHKSTDVLMDYINAVESEIASKLG